MKSLLQAVSRRTFILCLLAYPSIGATVGQCGGTHNVNAFTESGTHNGDSANTSFTIGQADFSGGLNNLDTLAGLIDEVAVFDHALAGAELDQLITQGPASFFGPVDPPDPTGDPPFISELANGIDLIYGVEASADLLTWTEVTDLMGAPVSNGDGSESGTIRDNIKFSEAAQRMMRLMVEKL